MNTEAAKYHYTECGLNNVWLVNGFEIHRTPYGEGVSIHDVDGLNVAIGLALVEKSAPLTPEEFRFLRVAMDLPQKSLASLVEVTEQTISLYERGKQKIPRLVDAALRQFYSEYCEKDSELRSLVERLVSLDHYIGELEREISFMETACGWEPRAA